MSDFRVAARALARRPLVTAVAVLSLALGIGVNTAIFSFFDRFLLRRLPVPAPERLVNVTSPGPRPGWTSTGDSGRVEAIFSYPFFRDLERLDTGVLRLAGHRNFTANLAHRGQTSDGEGVLVSGHYFPALGLTPALGRLLGPGDDRVDGGHPVVVLSHAYWSTRFGSDPAVLDDTLTINGEPLTIVGVAPAGFNGNTTLDRPQVFVPLTMAAQMFRRAEWTGLVARNDHWVYIFGRLEPGVSRAQVEEILNVPFGALIRDVEFPALRSGMGDLAREQFQQRRVHLEDGARGRNSDWAEVQTVVLLLFAVTGFVLAIACANVANLLLARVSERGTEIAVRLSIGASSSRLVRLLLGEACLLGVMGALGGMLVARLTLNGLLAMMPPVDVPMLDLEINAKVLAFALALGVGTSLLFGLFPAVHGVRAAIAAGLRAQPGRTSASRTATRFRTSLATAQVAIATALLAVAGLFVVSLANVGRVDLGLDRDGLVTFRLSPYLNGYTPAQSLALFERVEQELRGVPGVVSVTASSVPILADSSWGSNVTVEGFDATADTGTNASYARTGTEYFRTLGIQMVAGREFTPADAGASPRVAIVNEAFANRFNLGSQALGKRMALGQGDDKALDIEIVGLVRDAKHIEVKETATPQFFLPYRQDTRGRQDTVGPLTFYVRSTADARAVLAAIPPVVARLDASLPVTHLRTMEDQIWENTTRDRVLSTLSASFAVLATLLAAIGLYAVLAYGVAQRLHEIGIRMALGARSWNVRWLVFSQVGRIALVGGAIGTALALGVGRLGQAMLFGVDSSDATIVSAAVGLVLVVAFGAGVFPARRAALVDPVTALKAD